MLQTEQAATQVRIAPARSGWATVMALFLFMALNFADKAVVGLLAVPLMRDMHLSASQFGLVGSAFFALFAISAIGFGLVADRLNTTWLIAGLALVWVVAQVPMIWPTSLATLLVCRIVLGAGEGPALPLAMHVTYECFDDRQRSLPTIVVQLGATAGLILAGPTLTWISEHWHSRAAFLALSLSGVVWIGLWLLIRLVADGGEQSGEGKAARLRVPATRASDCLRLMRNRTVRCVLLQSFISYGVVAFGITWMPAYFRLGLGYSAATAGWLFALQVAGQIPVGLAASTLSHMLMKRRASTRLARGVLVSVCCVAGGLLLAGVMAPLAPLAKVLLTGLACALATQVFTFGPQLVAEVVPQENRAAMLSWVHALATLAGLIAPLALGHVVGAMAGARGFEIGFGVTGVLLVASGAAGFAWLRPERAGR
ncbi:MAG: MFS transporter [Paraburkholderia sp.]|jgi:MFS family permease|nr:MFS transporter [Paraburkholderia sp.]